MAYSEEEVITLDDEASSEPDERAPAVQPTRRRGNRFPQWAAHEGYGLCRGAVGPCTLGSNGSAAPAGSGGLCDLCNYRDLPDLHRHGQGRLTHLLLQLNPRKAKEVLERIDDAVGEGIAADLRIRMARARQRKRADRQSP